MRLAILAGILSAALAVRMAAEEAALTALTLAALESSEFPAAAQ